MNDLKDMFQAQSRRVLCSCSKGGCPIQVRIVKLIRQSRKGCVDEEIRKKKLERWMTTRSCKSGKEWLDDQSLDLLKVGSSGCRILPMRALIGQPYNCPKPPSSIDH